MSRQTIQSEMALPRQATAEQWRIQAAAELTNPYFTLAEREMRSARCIDRAREIEEADQVK